MTRALLTTLAVLMTTASPAAAQAAPGTFEWATYTGEGGTRRFKLYVPTTYRAGRPAPLVVLLHGCTQDPDDFARGTRFNEAAEAAGVLVAYPEQTGAHQPQKCWTWYDPAHQAAGAGEPAIVAGIARQVMASHAVDASRVFVAGVSAGGAMAVNAAAGYPDLFSAVGVHSGVAYRAAAGVMPALQVMKQGASSPDSLGAALTTALAGRRLPRLIAFHGTQDAVVAPENGRQLFGQWSRALGARDFLRDEETLGGRSVTRDRAGPGLQLWIVDGLGHAWSGGSPEGTYTDARGPDATREMLRFFLEDPC